MQPPNNPGGPPPEGGWGAPPQQQGGFGQPPQQQQGGFGQPPQQQQPGMYAQPMAMMNPAAPYGICPKTGLAYSEKQKMVAGLLQIFIGAFGAGRFYTGHTGIAIAQIAVTWLTCGIGALWPLIDGIMMLSGSVTDSDGRPLRD
ncbi:TM2 domain-containing protein [Desulfobulbus sp. AH-315-M07]|nr:TM2 domain-containing protein [Desulfobulbus sp. AH-315-M07]